jgi:hypothetical protein
LQRYAECSRTLDAVLSHPQAITEKITLTVEHDKPQEVPIAAAAHNLSGMLAIDHQKTSEAAAHFQKALEIEKNFVLAKKNLLYLENLKTGTTGSD